ncbi:hypothetical protein Hdeb2414_s0015g00443351 [Helianthus debilis subsp. tardiflorus]
MIPESPLPRDVEAAIEDSVPTLSANETIQWKRMYENPTRAFTFSEGILARGVKPFLLGSPQGFFSTKKLTLWRLLQGDSKDVKFVIGYRRVCSGWGSAVVEGGEGTSSDGEESSHDPLPVNQSSHDKDEDLQVRLVRKRKAVSPKPAPAPRDIRQKLQSASGQKPPPSTNAASELSLVGVKFSLSKHLRSSSLVSAPLLRFLLAPPLPAFRTSKPSQFEVSPHHATGTRKPSQFEGLVPRSPLAPLFVDALPFTYVSKWKITHSSVIGTPETARDFLSHAVPPSHRFMNSALRDDLFEDQYNMSLCEIFFRGAGMLQRVDDLRRANEELKGELKTFQSVAAEL